MLFKFQFISIILVLSVIKNIFTHPCEYFGVLNLYSLSKIVQLCSKYLNAYCSHKISEKNKN